MLRCRTDGSQGSSCLDLNPPAEVRLILDRGPVLGIIRYRSAGDLRGAIDAVIDGGVPLVEITIDTPGALGAIRAAAADGVTIGAGTVITPDDVKACADAGARVVVSPALVPEVVEAALGAGIEPIPGVLTPTELLSALRWGATAVKVFPAGPAGGPAYIRALRGPFPAVPLLPTGGIEPGDVRPLLDAGATCVGLGASLVGAEPPTAADLDAIRERAAAVIGSARA
jgi:2-dehydro-3-deoxyphosphogluconate aldolase/(4S)-4-hydroxy-2-oxoglutarate aldolase